MPRHTNTVRECPHCYRTGRQNRHVAYPFHTVREIDCQHEGCKRTSYSIELFTGTSRGHEWGKKVSQARELMQFIVDADVARAVAQLQTANYKFLEMHRAGLSLRTNAVRTCPSCGEPSHIMYGSNQGPFVRHGYQCTDKECAQRWLSAEFAMAPAPKGAILSDLAVCLPLIAAPAREFFSEVHARKISSNHVTQLVHGERAELIKEITSTREIKRLTDEEVLETARDVRRTQPAATFETLRGELARRFNGRVGWRRHVQPLWDQVCAEPATHSHL